MTKRLIFAGCSFTAGTGWDKSDLNKECKDHPDLWTNLCHKNILRFHRLDSINISKSGISNTEIFESVIQALGDHGSDIDTIFCQWTSMPRYHFNVGFELWDTKEKLHKVRQPYKHDVGVNQTIWPREYISDLVDRFRALHHIHWDIVKVVRYADVIERLTSRFGIQNVYFINGLCPWDKDYFKELQGVKPESYTNFTKEDILNIKTRDDEDIIKLYSLAHEHYRQAGGVNDSKWINLYDSFLSNRIDYNFDHCHPGQKSNKIFFSIINNRLEEPEQIQ